MSLASAISDQLGMAQRLIDSSIVGLTDDELLWEPAPGMWTLDGVELQDDEMDDPPFTTIGWRFVHMSVVVLGWMDTFHARDERQPPTLPRDAAGATALWRAAWQELVDAVTACSSEALDERVPWLGGEVARSYIVGHVITECVHHGAEIGCLRHLRRAQLVG